MEDLSRIEWNTFVIRLRRETQGSNWHGQIVHVTSQRDRHFTTLVEVVAFLAEHAPGLTDQTAAPSLPSAAPQEN